MAAYYHSHHNHHHHHDNNNNNNNNSTTSHEIPDHGNLHTLFLMNPNLAHHHNNPTTHGFDPHLPPPPQQQPSPSQNILLLNSAAAAAAAAAYSHSPPQHPHQFVRLPAPDPNNITLYGYPQEEEREITRARQGLSLSLSSQNPALTQHEGGGGAERNGVGGGQVSVLGSKYLRPAQELLEEVAHVGDHTLMFKGGASNTDDQSPRKGKGVDETASEERGKHGGGGGSSGGAQLSTAERQEIQMKKAKLVTMLDEAEQRYRQYHNQMQIVVESFERAAGLGSAKTYTALALKTISKQFRYLKDAIQGQIRAATKSLGEEEGGVGLGSSAGKIEGSRLKFIDHQIRQQRALQQLGMIQNHNAWRPQRGLPERSVSVLRAWLFEHFLHPYPKDSDKIMLAKQTGLTRSQVSNWFINARVRLWKPMIEEMYNEELKDQDHNTTINNNNSDDKAVSSKDFSNEDASASISISEQDNNVKAALKDQHNNNNNNNNNNVVANSCSSFMSMPANSPPPYKANNIHQNQQGFTLTGSLEMEGISQGSPKRQRSNNEVLGNSEIMIKFGTEKQGRDNGSSYPIISGGMNFIGGGELGSYPMSDIGRFDEAEDDFTASARFLQGNGISLSLGLPPSCENHHQQQQFNNISSTNNHAFMSSNQAIQFRRGNDFGAMSSPSSHSSAAAFECIDIQNRKTFAAQLLPDFVA